MHTECKYVWTVAHNKYFLFSYVVPTSSLIVACCSLPSLKAMHNVVYIIYMFYYTWNSSSKNSMYVCSVLFKQLREHWLNYIIIII